MAAQTDVYALAATFYECVTGQHPLPARTRRRHASAHRLELEPLEPINTARPARALDDVLAKGCRVSLHARYPTCEGFSRHAASSDVSRAGCRACRPSPARAGIPRSPRPNPPRRSPSRARRPRSPPSQTRSFAPPAAVARTTRRAARRAAKARARSAAGVIAAAAVVVIISSLLARATKRALLRLGRPAAACRTNHVTGLGHMTLRPRGQPRRRRTDRPADLDSGDSLVHVMHIHGGGKGECPPASAARLHNGHLAIDTNDGINYYGPPMPVAHHASATPASRASSLFKRYPSGGNDSLLAHDRAAAEASSARSARTTR